MDHLLDITGLRFMLLVGALISGLFGFTWLLDAIQLRHTPWSDEGVGKYSCLVKAVGGVMLLMMFRHSVVALAYFDEDGDRLQRRKERYLDEMTKQVGDVLLRATTQAQTLCGMLSAQLDEKVGEHVRRMQRILQQCEKLPSAEATSVYMRLAELMALHLHQLRKPAIDHFQKLIALSGKASDNVAFLGVFLGGDLATATPHQHGEAAHRQQHQDWQIGLATHGDSGRGSRDGAFDGRPLGLKVATQLVTEFTAYTNQRQSMECQPSSRPGAQRWCTCCYKRKSPAESSRPQRTTSFDQTFSLPSYDDMADELREPTVEDMKNYPEAVVLRPVKLVLKWFEKIEPMHSRKGDPRAEVLRGIPPGGSPNAAMGHIKGAPRFG
eukprot:symbB.v1.2.014436.t1/scaffold1054.1/size141114/8